MSKVYTNHPFVATAPVEEGQLGGAMRDISEALSNIEWRLIGENTVGMADVGYLGLDGFTGETSSQDSYSSGTGWWILSEVHGSTETSPKSTFYPIDIPSTGWNSLYDMDFNLTSTVITIPPGVGVASGGFCIDSELRTSAATPHPSNQPYTNRDLWWEFGVFANGIKIGQSPRLFAGRHSVYIPYTFFTGAELTTITVQMACYIGQQMFLGSTAIEREPLAIHSVRAHCRATSF